MSADGFIKWSNAMKWNVDRSSLGKPGPAGVGGVLRRDHNGLLLRLFSIPEDKFGKEVVVESDSRYVVDWMTKKSIRPWFYQNLFTFASRFSSCLGPVTYIHTLREPNHNLAKQNISRYGKWQRLEKNLRTDIRLSTSLVELALAQHHLMEIPSAKGGR
ncbi:hypothetical protein NC651_005463 [Populus alba x Populus x berolinensis]|nr:hypothetical protein NC651_005463 [Populus alba x Populus x berolinensis]